MKGKTICGIIDVIGGIILLILDTHDHDIWRADCAIAAIIMGIDFILDAITYTALAGGKRPGNE